MKPRKQRDVGEQDLFRARLDNIINPRHELVRLAGAIAWQRFEAVADPLFADIGNPALPTRLMFALMILKHMYGLSDEALVARWVENPYFQYFCGESFFQHEAPFDRSSLTRWRQRLGEEHLSELIKESLAAAGEASVLTDKAPLNFRHLGLIALLFPGARIVHCRRDPLDTCLSCFFQNFAKGQEYSFDLAELGRFYRDYRRMMAAWAEILPIEVFDLDYEELVADLEGVGRSLLAYCGLDWHPDCARFFETRRPVLTASRVQVRRPLYSSSIGKWRRYASHLGPLVEALGPYAKGQ